jgi:hypothetical protein
MEYIVAFDGFNNVTCNASARPRTVTLLSGVSASGQLTCNVTVRAWSALKYTSAVRRRAWALGRRAAGPLLDRQRAGPGCQWAHGPSRGRPGPGPTVLTSPSH